MGLAPLAQGHSARQLAPQTETTYLRFNNRYADYLTRKARQMMNLLELAD
jgi:uncharacterized protein YecE (DUF72 family)